MSVATSKTSRPMVLTTSVLLNRSGYGSPPLRDRMTYEPLRPTPSRMLSIGPPKQAAKPITGANAATETFATKSASELPTAKIVSPIIASLRPKMKPKVWDD